MKKGTKEKILDKALDLFNKHGVENTTVRDIAAEVGISHGNLCYHFPNIENLTEHLYRQLVSELDLVFQAMTQEQPSLKYLQQSSALTFELLYKYRFLMLDFVTIMRKNEQVRKHYRQLYRQRKEQFRKTICWMQKEGYMVPELYPGHYDAVIEQLFIIGDFWISSSEILYEGKEKDKVSHYINIMNQVLLPYLTKKAHEELKEG